MNNAAHIRLQARELTERGQITSMQLVEIIEELTEPYVGGNEPEHFERVNKKIHHLLNISDPL